MTIRIIDIETTGVDPATDHMVEIASVDLTRDGIGKRQTTLVRLPEGVSMPPQASAVHHLIDSDLAAGQAKADALAQFLGADAYVAHRAAFEQSFLPGWGRWVCTWKCALRVWPDAPAHNLQTLRYWRGHVAPFGIPREEISPHRALSDCIVTAAILHDLIKAVAWSQLVQWSNEPALLPRLPFGKHRGERFDAVPADYLDWIVSKSDLDEDMKFSASYWLAKRTQAA